MIAELGVAFFGHNLVHTFERWSFPFLVVIFAIASVVIVSKAHPGAHVAGVPGGWLITFGAAFGYAAGWNPYASDYTRYLPPDTNRRATGLWAAAGVFLSCIALEIVGAAAATITDVGKYADNPTAGFTSHLTPWLADITLLAIALGAVCANALNIYSGSMSFLAMGIRIHASMRRAIVAVVFGVAGFFLALSGLHDAGTKYNDFLLIIAYWIGPWLGVFFADQWLRRGKRVDGFLFDRKHNPVGRVRRDGHRDRGVHLLLRQPGEVRRPGAQALPGVRRHRVRGRVRARGRPLRDLLPLPEGQHEGGTDAHPGHDGRLYDRVKVTGSSAPAHTTVCWAGVARATTLPPRSTRVRGATRRSASASDVASNTTRSAGPPSRRP